MQRILNIPFSRFMEIAVVLTIVVLTGLALTMKDSQLLNWITIGFLAFELAMVVVIIIYNRYCRAEESDLSIHITEFDNQPSPEVHRIRIWPSSPKVETKDTPGSML